MNKIVLIFIILFFVIFFGCAQSEQSKIIIQKNLPTEEIKSILNSKYGQGFDWHLQTGEKSIAQSQVNLLDDYIKQYSDVGINMVPYVGEYLTVFKYDLEQTCIKDGVEQNFQLVLFISEDDEYVGDLIVLVDSDVGRLKTGSTKRIFEEVGCSD